LRQRNHHLSLASGAAAGRLASVRI
jgi:hypothetical protein